MNVTELPAEVRPLTLPCPLCGTLHAGLARNSIGARLACLYGQAVATGHQPLIDHAYDRIAAMFPRLAEQLAAG